MEDLQEKFNSVLASFSVEPAEKRIKFETLAQELIPTFNDNLVEACTKSGVELKQHAILIPQGVSLAKARMSFHWYIKSEKLDQPLKLELSYNAYSTKPDDIKVAYLQQVIDKSIKSLNQPKKKTESLSSQFEKLIKSFQNGYSPSPVQLEVLGNVNRLLRPYRNKIFYSSREPNVWDYFYKTKIPFNEIINIIKEVE